MAYDKKFTRIHDGLAFQKALGQGKFVYATPPGSLPPDPAPLPSQNPVNPFAPPQAPKAPMNADGTGGSPSFPIPLPIELPPHLFIPPTVFTVDIKNLAAVSPGATLQLIKFVCPEGAITHLLSYAIFNDGLLATNFDFYPRIDGRRIFPFHGDPLDNFRIYLGVDANLGANSLIQAYTTMQPGQILTWDVQNRDVVDTVMGVRVVGYVDRTQERKQGRFGG